METPEEEIDESPCLFIDWSFPSVVLPASLKNLSKESLVRAVLQKLVLQVIMGSKKLNECISVWNRIRVNICMQRRPIFKGGFLEPKLVLGKLKVSPFCAIEKTHSQVYVKVVSVCKFAVECSCYLSLWSFEDLGF